MRQDASGNSKRPVHRIAWLDADFFELMYYATNDKGKLPDYIWEASYEARLEMLAGLMDTDGSVILIKNFVNPTYMLSYGGVKPFVQYVPALFDRCNIRVGKVSTDRGRKAHYQPYTRFSPSIGSAVKHGFYFRCSRKMERIREYVRLHTDLKVYDPPNIGLA